jgi:hypothetical protein
MNIARPHTREATALPRPQGRPPASEVRPPAVEVQPVLIPDLILPVRCDLCGRNVQPRVIRRNPDGGRVCVCPLCPSGGDNLFVYTPPTIRRLK